MKANDVAAHWESNAETWTIYSRAGYDKYRDALNTPTFLEMLPSVGGLRGLDLGCGEGSNTRAVARLGARVTGLDIAPTFIRYARESEADAPLGIDYVLGDGQSIDFREASFDFVTAFMSMMDMADQREVLKGIHRILKPGGFLQFSILHPCFVPPTRRNIRNEAGEPVAVEIADYFDESDGRIDRWIFSSIPQAERAALTPFSVPRFHRTLSTWVSMNRRSGAYDRGLRRADGLSRSGAGLTRRRRHPRRADLPAYQSTQGIGPVFPPRLRFGTALSSHGNHRTGAIARQLHPVGLVAAEEIDILPALVDVIEQADMKAPAGADHHDIPTPGGADADRLAELLPGRRHVGVGRRLP